MDFTFYKAICSQTDLSRIIIYCLNIKYRTVLQTLSLLITSISERLQMEGAASLFIFFGYTFIMAIYFFLLTGEKITVLDRECRDITCLLSLIFFWSAYKWRHDILHPSQII